MCREISTNEYTKIVVIDEKGIGGANHCYTVCDKNVTNQTVIDNGDFTTFGLANFQNGPIKENGVNGCQNEDLIAIVIDRLQGFQDGDYRCRENALAITKLEEALMWLQKRTADRKARGVEGLNIK